MLYTQYIRTGQIGIPVEKATSERFASIYPALTITRTNNKFSLKILSPFERPKDKGTERWLSKRIGTTPHGLHPELQ